MSDIVTLQLWDHGKPLPEGASHVEGATVTDHHRFYGSLIVLGSAQSAGEVGGEQTPSTGTVDTPGSAP